MRSLCPTCSDGYASDEVKAPNGVDSLPRAKMPEEILESIFLKKSLARGEHSSVFNGGDAEDVTRSLSMVGFTAATAGTGQIHSTISMNYLIFV